MKKRNDLLFSIKPYKRFQLKLSLLTLLIVGLGAVSSCDKIELATPEEESLDRLVTVSTLHSEFDAYTLILELNHDTVAAWDTVGNISLSINAIVGDMIEYTVVTNTEYGAVLQMESAPDTVPFLYISLAVSGQEIAYGYGVVE